MREYKICYVAFMDILGFKSLLRDKTKSCEDIAQIFDEIKKQYDIRENGNPMIDKDEIHFKVMSDSVCIFIDSSIENSLLVLVMLCVHFQIRLLRLPTPVLVRGGISQGNVYLDSDIMFGPGMCNAYELESVYAKYPRIIVPLKLVDDYDMNDMEKKSILSSFLFRDFDEFYTTNCYELYTGWGYKQEDGERLIDHIYNVLCNPSSPEVREKYLYFQSHVVPAIENEKRKQSPCR